MHFLKIQCLNQEMHGLSNISASKSLKKNEKIKNQKICSDSSINNHTHVPDTQDQLIWLKPREMIREKKSLIINFRTPKIAWLETSFG